MKQMQAASSKQALHSFSAVCPSWCLSLSLSAKRLLGETVSGQLKAAALAEVLLPEQSSWVPWAGLSAQEGLQPSPPHRTPPHSRCGRLSPWELRLRTSPEDFAHLRPHRADGDGYYRQLARKGENKFSPGPWVFSASHTLGLCVSLGSLPLPLPLFAFFRLGPARPSPPLPPPPPPHP